MKDAILIKIARVLQNPSLLREATVVYLLVEIRKFLEQDEALMLNLPTLLFYCDWVLHHELDRAAAQRFLQAIYPRLEWRDCVASATMEAFDRFMTLGIFRDELGTFLRSNDLPCNLIDDQVSWIHFVKTYADVVKDCKLIVRPRSLPPLPRLLDCFPFVVQSLAIEPIDERDVLSASRPFPMKWTVEYRHKDGTDVVARGEFRMTASGMDSRRFSV